MFKIRVMIYSKIKFYKPLWCIGEKYGKRRVGLTAKRVSIVLDFTVAEANRVPKKSTKYTRFGKRPESFCEMLKEVQILFIPLVFIFCIV